MRKILPISIVVILVLTGLGAVATPQEQNFEIKKINVAFSKLTYEDESDYITINVEGANNFLIEEGKPLLPMYAQQIILPFGTKIKSIKVTPKNIVEKNLPKDITSSPIAMIAGSQVQTNSVKTSEISDPYPNNWYDYDIRVGLENNERALIIDTYFYPVSYHSKDNTISWAKQAEITVEYEPSQVVSSASDEEYNLIILTADEYYDELNPLIAHKTSRNISTKIVKLSEILNGAYFPVMGDDDAEKVKYFIYHAADEIEGWNTKNVMLVGNKDQFPIRETHVKVSSDDKEVFASDLYFADILMYNEETEEYEFCSWDSNDNGVYAEYKWDTGTDTMDLEPDVAVGRLAANDEEETTTVVNKIINYENMEAYTQNWFFDMVYCGGDSFIDEDHDPNGVLEGEYVNEHVMGIMDGFIPKKMWVSNNVLTRNVPTGVSSINEAISEGCGFVDMSGHGNTDVWATHPPENAGKWVPTPFGQYHSTNIGELTNGDKLPVVITGACSVSKFSKDKTCFSWTWLSTNGGGGIGSFGATGLGYAYISTHVISGLVEGIAIETFAQYKEGAITLGEMWTRALNGYMKDHRISDGGEYKTVLEWELFGDPTLSISDQSTAPEKPQKPSGPTSGKPEVELTYTSSTTDADDDEVYYLFEWGDGEFSEWIGPKNSGEQVTASHTWTSEGNFSIRVKAKDDHGILSEWSDPLSISMPKNKSIIYRPFLSRIFELFPFLKEIFNF
ncbi:MAG: hypothetical protein BV456_07345 [Thermoplasmata archaeon M8B2D]|nr:MAG: hypothetical protein BV456_07345 [Thermoplasmata archaeon M8B2D]